MSALEVRTRYAAAQQDLAAGLATARVADLAAARSTDQRHHERQGARDQLTATLAGLCGDDDVEQLRSRLGAEDVSSLPPFSGDIAIDAGTASPELDEAEERPRHGGRRLRDAATRRGALAIGAD